MEVFFSNRYRHIKRFRHIVNILSKHGLGHIFENTGLKNAFRFSRNKPTSTKIPLTIAERLPLVLAELGPTFIKLGQVISTRPDLLPPIYLAQMERLQDQVPPVSFDSIKQVIESELGRPLTQVFSWVSETPIATASIGQVHKATLLTGEEVVIKVQRPGVKRTVAVDLEILADLAEFLEAHTEWGKFYHLEQLHMEFARSIREELDYTIEARNCSRIQKNFEGISEIKIPKIYWDYSSSAVLVIEYLEGIKISATTALETAGIDRQKVAKRITDAFLKQLLLDGFFHADLHPGNIMIAPNEKIIFLDFGMMGRLDEWMRDQLGALTVCIIKRDINGVLRIFAAMGSLPSQPAKQSLRRELSRLFDQYLNLPLSEIKIGKAFQELMEFSFSNHLKFPHELTLVIRSLVLMEGIIEKLNPGLSLFELASPYSWKLLQAKLSPERITRISWDYLQELWFVISKLPEQAGNLLQAMEAGEFKVILELKHFELMVNRLNLIGNRLSFSIIVASIIIGSSLIALRKTNESLFGIFPVAEVGFVIAVLMGIWLLISIIRSGKI